MKLSAPEPLSSKHDTNALDCGVDSLNDWLKLRALKNQVSDASRTFVVCQGQHVVAYYALASSAVAVESTTRRVRRNMPNSIPVVVLGRLAEATKQALRNALEEGEKSGESQPLDFDNFLDNKNKHYQP